MTKHYKAKRAKERQLNKKKVIICILVVIIIIVGIYFAISQNPFKSAKNNTNDLEEKNNIQNSLEENTENNTENNTEEPQNQEQEDEISDAVIPEKMGNYEVLGQIVIEKIGVTKNILNISEDASLKLSVAKLYGPNVNSSGNFCICGHNWNNMLKRLSEMQVGDEFYIINRKTKTKVDYKIYKKYTCVPEDLSCLDQNNDGKREVTLITCNPGGLTRLICKARET